MSDSTSKPMSQEEANKDYFRRRRADLGLPKARATAELLGAGLDSMRAAVQQLNQVTAAVGLIWYATLDRVMPQQHLVKDLLLAGSLFVVFGESNSGKTFWMLDLCMAVASGLLWRGRYTVQGIVIYVAGEGATSVKTRTAAYRMARPGVPANTPFAIWPHAVDLLNPVAVKNFLADVEAARDAFDLPIAMIVFDTFARSIPGANENDAADVGKAVAVGDHIRMKLRCAVGFIHHSGKDPTKGARGSSALRAAVDTEIYIEGQSGQRTASITKQRDLDPGIPMPFELVSVSVGTDPEDDKPITSCVIRHVDAEEKSLYAGLQIRGKAQRTFLTAMRARTEKEPDRIWTLADLRHVGRETGLGKSTARSVVDTFTGSPYLKATVGGYRFTDGRVEG